VVVSGTQGALDHLGNLAKANSPRQECLDGKLVRSNEHSWPRATVLETLVGQPETWEPVPVRR